MCLKIINMKFVQKKTSDHHLHQVDVDCEFYKFKLNNTYYHLPTSFDISFNDNFYSALNVINACREIRKSLKKEDNSFLNIICISSICGHENIQGAPIQYSVSKSALNNMVKIYSKELIREGIVLNAISPGNMMFQAPYGKINFAHRK